MECPKIKVSRSDYLGCNGTYSRASHLNHKMSWTQNELYLEYKKDQKQYWEFENLNENKNCHHDANGLEEQGET